ncbi:helix-turn-helix domain-containing protein [Nonomuraea sp. SYSU D8015]|uniref:helix-turn-helix domain-containing protein n=1 Tax=Nonomuraea sp. SYSU D8015 TaxID=2593644 RepID=UPI0016607312|nr:hypothetical protein [Nonomuraea sp. SYSU D8015]
MSRSAPHVGQVGMVVAENVRVLRKARRVSADRVEEVSAARGHRLDRFALSAIERGRRRVDVDELVILAGLLGVEPAVLLTPVKVRLVIEEAGA